MFFGCSPCCGPACIEYSSIASDLVLSHTTSLTFGNNAFTRTYGITETVSSTDSGYKTLPGENTSFEPYFYKTMAFGYENTVPPVAGVLFSGASVIEIRLYVKYGTSLAATVVRFRFFFVPCGAAAPTETAPAPPSRSLLHGFYADAAPMGMKFFGAPHQLDLLYTTQALGGASLTGNGTQPGYWYPGVSIAAGTDFGIAPTALNSAPISLLSRFTVGPLPNGNTFFETISFSVNGLSGPLGQYIPVAVDSSTLVLEQTLMR